MDRGFTGWAVPSFFQSDPESFSAEVLEVFRFQHTNNKVYRAYCDLLHIDAGHVSTLGNIPFLPISFFKTKELKTGEFEPELIFESSGTTGMQTSRHLVKRKSFYEKSFLTAFEKFYGDADYSILALLPSYLEQKHSSLVYMTEELIRRSPHSDSGLYLNETENLRDVILKNESAEIPTLLLGVTYALLDFAEKYPMPLRHTIVMETGGMKGRREELTRPAVHKLLCSAFGLEAIHSEYGMTELLSQAYSSGNGIFRAAPWMRILIRSEDDPFDVTAQENITGPYKTGAINIIDLANLHSCAFIATDDAGKLYADGRFEISGRLDNSDIRGCSLMVI